MKNTDQNYTTVQAELFPYILQFLSFPFIKDNVTLATTLCLTDQKNKLPMMAGFQLIKVPLYTGLTAPHLFMAGGILYDGKQLHSAVQNKYSESGTLVEFKFNTVKY